MADNRFRLVPEAFEEQWSAMTLYEKFEQVVILMMSGIIAVIVAVSLWALLREVVLRLVFGVLDPLDHATFQVVFGMILTVVIALEFKRSLLVVAERRFGILQVRTIILIALLAIVRKFIIVDLGATSPLKILALAAATLTLGIVYWLVRDQDIKERAEQRAEEG
ncbi:MAG: phosphate-starvation-inducible PsiE family protein [Methyloligellaceae bacterium]